MLLRLIAITIKEVRQLARDRLTFGMIVGIPLMQILLFGYAINFDVRDLHAAVVDEAKTSHSRALRRGPAGDRRDRPAAAERRASPDLRRRMESGEISVGIVIPARLRAATARATTRAVAQILIDGSEPMIDTVARGLVVGAAAAARGDYRVAHASVFEVRTEYNPERRTAVQIVPALIGVILNMTMVIFTAAAIVRERERGNLELLIATPIRSWELMAGKLLPYVLIGLVQTTLILTVGALLFDVPINGSLLDLYLAAAAVHRGHADARPRDIDVCAHAVPGLPDVVPDAAAVDPAVGLRVPVRRHAAAAQWLAQVLPLTHFVEMIRGILLRGAPLSDLCRPAAKLLVFLVVMLAIATLRFHKRLD